VHHLGGFGLHQPGAVIEMRDHELGHVGARGRQAARGGGDHHFEGLRFLRDVGIALRHMRRERLRQRLAKGRVRHAERLEDVTFDIAIEILAAHPLDDIARERGGVVRIGGGRARREDAFGQRERHLFLERHHRLGIAADQVAHRFLEARGVRHDVAHRDRLALEGRDPEIEIGVDVLVEVDLAAFDLLHHRGPGDELRHRTGTEERRFGQHRRAFRDVRITIAFLENDLAALDHDHDGARDAAAFERIGEVTVEPGFEVCAVERDRRGGRLDRWQRRGRGLLGGRGRDRPLRHQRNRGERRQSDHQLANETHRHLPFLRRSRWPLQRAARPLTKG
jgi:hypothetical protein